MYVAQSRQINNALLAMFEPTTTTLRNTKFQFSYPFTKNKNLLCLVLLQLQQDKLFGPHHLSACRVTVSVDVDVTLSCCPECGTSCK